MSRIPSPPPTEPAIDPNTGQWTQPWYSYISQVDLNAPRGFFQVDLNSTNQTGVTQNATTTAVAFNNEVVDTDLWFDSTTFTYTPLEAGYYQFHASVFVSPLTTTYTPEVGIARNSSVLFWGEKITGVSSGFGATGTVDGMVLMNGSSDSVQILVKSPSATIQGDPTRTFAYGYKIGST